MKKLTKEQAVVLSGFTGILMCNFSDLQADVERRVGNPVYTHQFGNKEFSEEVKNLYRSDFMKIMPIEKAE